MPLVGESSQVLEGGWGAGPRSGGAIFRGHLGRAGAQGHVDEGGSSRHENRMRFEILSGGPNRVPLGVNIAEDEVALGVDVVLHEVLQPRLPAARRGGQLLVLRVVHRVSSLNRERLYWSYKSGDCIKSNFIQGV